MEKTRLPRDMQKLLDNIRQREMEDEPPQRAEFGARSALEEKIDHLSPTKIDMFARCPMQIEWRYVKGVVSPPQIRLIEGAKYHETAAVRNTLLMNGKSPATKVEMIEFFQDTLRDDISRMGAKTIVWDEENKDADTIMDRAKKLVPILHEDLKPIGVPTSVEDRVEGTIAGIPIVAITDLEDGGGLADYKVVTNKKSQIVADSSIQLSTYSYLKKEKRVRLDQLVKRGGHERTRSVRTAGDFKWLEQVVTRTWQAITAGAFAPCDPTSWVCSPKWCGWYLQCRGSYYSTGRRDK